MSGELETADRGEQVWNRRYRHEAVLKAPGPNILMSANSQARKVLLTKATARRHLSLQTATSCLGFMRCEIKSIINLSPSGQNVNWLPAGRKELVMPLPP